VRQGMIDSSAASESMTGRGSATDGSSGRVLLGVGVVLGGWWVGFVKQLGQPVSLLEANASPSSAPLPTSGHCP
jgi:hypothetical protein